MFLLLQFENKLEVEYSEEAQTEHSRYLIQTLLPFLENLKTEQETEREFEATRKGEKKLMTCASCTTFAL